MSRVGQTLEELLTPKEDPIDSHTLHIRFDIDLLAERLLWATDWLSRDARTQALPLAYFAASTAAAAAASAAARRPDAVRAVVCRARRVDLTSRALGGVRAPTLLIVGGDDRQVLAVNRRALPRFAADDKDLAVIPGATHLFEEPRALESVADLATSWASERLGRSLAGQSSAYL